MKAKISYQTLLLPPPYAHGYTLELELAEKQVKVDYQLEYLNRDTISEDEVIEEGFSLNDDYEWKGELGEKWTEILKSAFSKIELEETGQDENIWIHVDLDGKSGLVVDVKFWDYQLQELIQAIYEKAKREHPLKLAFRLVNAQTKDYTLIGKFAERTVTINEEQVSWETLKSLMEQLYLIEFSEAPQKATKTTGLWVDFEGNGAFFLIKDQKIAEKITTCLTA